MDNRIKSFDGIFNYRDFGGYQTQDGSRVASGKLFRSAHLNNCSDNDLNQLGAFNIKLVVDLRHAPERKRQPSKWPESQNPLVLTYPDPKNRGGAKMAPHEAFVKNELHTPEDARNYMIKSYGARPDDAGFRQIFGDTLRHMAKTGDPILVHCAAGKDRTGTLCALIQGALGIAPETIMQDYMLTMRAVNIDEFLGLAAKMYEKRYERPFDPEAVRPMFGVEPAYLESSLATIKDMDNYCLLYTSPSPRDKRQSRMPSSA